MGGTVSHLPLSNRQPAELPPDVSEQEGLPGKTVTNITGSTLAPHIETVGKIGVQPPSAPQTPRKVTPQDTHSPTVQHLGSFAVMAQKPTSPEAKQFTADEVKALHELAESLPSDPADEKWEHPNRKVRNRVQLTYADIQAKSQCSFPEAHELLQRLDQVPPDIRDRVQHAALMLHVNNLGHEWSLKGKVEIGDHKIKLEGTAMGYMDTRVARRVHDSCNESSVGQAPLLAGFGQNDRERLERAYNSAADLANVATLANRPAKAKEAFETFAKDRILVIPTGWRGHAISLVLFEDCHKNRYLAYVNRGEKSRGETLEDSNSDIKIFRMHNELTEDIVKQLLNEPASGRLTRLPFFEGDRDNGMKKLLGLELIATIEKKSQKVGNCGWANLKASLHAALLFMMMDKRLARAASPDAQAAITQVEDDARKVYKEWTADSRAKELKAFLSLFEKFSSQKPCLNKSDSVGLIQQICSKLVDKSFFMPYQSDARAMREEVEKYVAQSESSLAEWVSETPAHFYRLDDDEKTEQSKTVLREVPGAFIVFKTSEDRLRLVYTTKEGVSMHQDFRPDQTPSLKELCKTKNLKYPISLTSELYASITEKVTESRTFATEERARVAIQTMPVGSFVFYKTEEPTICRSLIMMPQKNIVESLYGIDQESRVHLSDEKMILQDSKHYFEYSPLQPRRPPLETFIQRVKNLLKNENDYAVVNVKTIPEGVDIDSESELTDTMQLLVKRGNEVVAYPLDPHKKLLDQIDKKLVP